MRKINFFFLYPFLLLAFISTGKSQIQWKDYSGNPILIQGAGWDSHYVDVGSVIQQSDSNYVMWYSGSSDGVTPRIGRAISIDGIIWGKDSLNPVLQVGFPWEWDKAAAFNPCVLTTNLGYVMYYTGAKSLTSPPFHTEIGRATSIDGRLWMKDSLNPVLTYGHSSEWDSIYLDIPSVLFDGTTYKMWYNGAAGGFPSFTSSIGYATSTDGIHWTKCEQNPVLKSGSSDSWDKNGIGLSEVIYDLGYYRMWYEGNITNYHNGYMGGIGYAVSEDGINWKKYPGNPVIPRNFISWHQGTPHNPTIIRNGNELRMWYTALGNVGLATSQLSSPLITIPNSMSFRATDNQVNDTKSIIIGNWGYTPLTPLIIDSLYNLNSNFTILNPPPPPFSSIQPFDDIKIQIVFHPTQGGTYEDTLFISSNDTSQPIKKIVLKGQSLITDVDDNSSELPLQFRLDQNYPNPFNPSTTIEYQLSTAGKVTLKIYDVLGNEVETLVNKDKPAGKYEAEFNGANLPSGIYIYKIQSGVFIQTKKMILLK